MEFNLVEEIETVVYGDGAYWAGAVVGVALVALACD